MNNKTMKPVNPAEHEVFEIIDGVSNLLLTARKLEAIVTAFADGFTDCAAGADLQEISARPEHFCFLFDALRDYAVSVKEQAQAVDDRGSAYLHMKRQQAAGSPTGAATDDAGENPLPTLETPTGATQAAHRGDEHESI